MIVDSVSNITKELSEDYGIDVIPYYITYGGRTYKEDFNFDRVRFYKDLKELKEFPTTAHPNMEDIFEAFSSVSKRYDEVVYLTVPSDLTKTFDLAVKIRERFPDKRIEIYQGGIGIGRLALLSLEAARMAEKGKGIEEVLEWIELCNQRAGFFGVLNTLEYLAKGGRIGKAQALLSSVLAIKPILTYREESVVPEAKVSTHRQALDWIIKKMRRDIEEQGAKRLKCVIDDAGNREWSCEVKERIEKEFTCEELWQLEMSPVVGTHMGPGAWAVSYLLIY